MEKISERLKELRLSKNLNYKGIERESGINYKSFYNWETGASFPTTKFLIILAKFFNVTSDYLLGLDEDIQEDNKN